MGRADYFEEGSWNVRCSMCFFKRKASTMVKNWQGLYRCREHDEPRHPQDYVRAVADVQTPPWTQSPGTDVYVSFCTPNGLSAVPGSGEPGCMTPGYLSPAYLEGSE